MLIFLNTNVLFIVNIIYINTFKQFTIVDIVLLPIKIIILTSVITLVFITFRIY